MEVRKRNRVKFVHWRVKKQGLSSKTSRTCNDGQSVQWEQAATPCWEKEVEKNLLTERKEYENNGEREGWTKALSEGKQARHGTDNSSPVIYIAFEIY